MSVRYSIHLFYVPGNDVNFFHLSDKETADQLRRNITKSKSAQFGIFNYLKIVKMILGKQLNFLCGPLFLPL